MKAVPLIALGIAYVCGAVFTFGLVWNRIQCVEKPGLTCTEVRVASSLASATGWPLALSAIYQEGGDE
ncbi:hypothetical protein LH464_04340 [Neorhizobium sp. T786]|uniref:hypothetical protein n=1 Tax=Pseudorhizobium xiangyangii TaxID=2883104 RepID=UPI001CFF7EB4|nr:hypothetical protein [Neorhizobium xiangyangii]MCB5201707.1 hypothetical protein [Neorhizobium xiangyangii]